MIVSFVIGFTCGVCAVLGTVGLTAALFYAAFRGWVFNAL